MLRQARRSHTGRDATIQKFIALATPMANSVCAWGDGFYRKRRTLAMLWRYGAVAARQGRSERLRVRAPT
jgi:hypothetical protein